MGQKVHPTGGSAQKSTGALPAGRCDDLLLPHPGAADPSHPHGGHCGHERSACHDRAGCLSGQNRPQSHLYPPPALRPFGGTAGGDPTADDRLSDASSSRMAADRHGAHHCECGTNIAVYAQRLGLDSSYAVQMVCLSTLLSLITLPVILSLAAALGFA